MIIELIYVDSLSYLKVKLTVRGYFSKNLPYLCKKFNEKISTKVKYYFNY